VLVANDPEVGSGAGDVAVDVGLRDAALGGDLGVGETEDEQGERVALLGRELDEGAERVAGGGLLGECVVAGIQGGEQLDAGFPGVAFVEVPGLADGDGAQAGLDGRSA